MAPKKSKPPKDRSTPDTPRGAPTISDDPAKQSAFERWMAEERAIQAQRFRDDPLAGEEIMDATARLLAPKGEHSRIGELERRQDRLPGLERGREGSPRTAYQSEWSGKRPGHAANASQTPPFSRGGKKDKDGRQHEKPAQPPKAKTKQVKAQPAPQRPQPVKPAPAPQPKAKPAKLQQSKSKAPVTQKQPKPTSAGRSPLGARPGRLPATHDRPGSPRAARRGPMEPTLRLGSQKDSTEQQSLMKPYYFNPSED